jgi:large subunit ribosomal protein L19
MDAIRVVESKHLRETVPAFAVGDTVKVHYRVVEGEKERVQVFQGTVIGRRGDGTRESFIVRKVTAGVGVERIFPLHSRNINHVEVVRAGRVRRAKLFYLRGKKGKAARVAELKEVREGAPKALGGEAEA